MSANYFELLKYAATGIASPSMTYYDKMRASTLMGGAVQTLTGIPPLSFKSNGTPLISWSMLGNGEQTGTPSSQSIIMPTFCGVRTANLFDISTAEKGRIDNGTVGYASNTTGMTVSDGAVSFTTNATYRGVCFGFIEIPSGADSLSFSGTFSGGNGIGKKFVFYDAQKAWMNKDYALSITVSSETVAIPSGAKYVRLSMTAQAAGTETISNFMLNAGTEPLPYEPYGWAEKITCAGQTVPVYLGQTKTVRRVRKLVLTGDERDWIYAAAITATDAFQNATVITGYKREAFYCSHMVATTSSESTTTHGYIGQRLTLCMDKALGLDTVDKFKSYLAAQYAAGTPVTVWYVLAEPKTGIVNEPLAKIGDYADELHSEDAGVSIPTVNGNNTLTVETDLQPSEMTITFKG